jgi:hypothetical protein
MGHNVIARAEPDPLQHGSQCQCRTNNAIVQQIGMRQMAGAREMPATAALRMSSPVNSARVRVSNTCASPGS